MMRQAIEALATFQPDALLINCASPNDATAILRMLIPSFSGPVGVYPHTGHFDPPEWLFTDAYPPERYATIARTWIDRGARIVRGCCGTTPDHIAALAKEITGRT